MFGLYKFKFGLFFLVPLVSFAFWLSWLAFGSCGKPDEHSFGLLLQGHVAPSHQLNPVFQT